MVSRHCGGRIVVEVGESGRHGRARCRCGEDLVDVLESGRLGGGGGVGSVDLDERGRQQFVIAERRRRFEETPTEIGDPDPAERCVGERVGQRSRRAASGGGDSMRSESLDQPIEFGEPCVETFGLFEGDLECLSGGCLHCVVEHPPFLGDPEFERNLGVRHQSLSIDRQHRTAPPEGAEGVLVDCCPVVEDRHQGRSGGGDRRVRESCRRCDGVLVEEWELGTARVESLEGVVDLAAPSGADGCSCAPLGVSHQSPANQRDADGDRDTAQADALLVVGGIVFGGGWLGGAVALTRDRKADAGDDGDDASVEVSVCEEAVAGRRQIVDTIE